jgi:Xaa-Pro aminopeptidase
LQASQELDCNWEMVKLSTPDHPSYTEFLSNNLTSGSIVAADPTLFGAKSWLDMTKELEKNGIKMISLAENLIDVIWTEENGRPPLQVLNQFDMQMFCRNRLFL